jgi:purine-binding chemotaxis protein CheW
MTDHNPNQAKGQGSELLSVRVNDQDFAIDIMSVREIRGWTPSTPLPHAPAYIKGMVNLRGTVMTIISLAERLRMPATEPNASSVVVVVEGRGRMVGVLVDAVSDIINIDPSMVQEPPNVGSTGVSKVVNGLLTLEGRIVSIIGIDAIIPDELMEETGLAA